MNYKSVWHVSVTQRYLFVLLLKKGKVKGGGGIAYPFEYATGLTGIQEFVLFMILPKIRTMILPKIPTC